MVPRSRLAGTPCFSPATMTIASSTAAGALMVMLTLTLSSGMPSSSASMSASESMATPACPTSPAANGSSLS